MIMNKDGSVGDSVLLSAVPFDICLVIGDQEGARKPLVQQFTTMPCKKSDSFASTPNIFIEVAEQLFPIVLPSNLIADNKNDIVLTADIDALINELNI